MKAAGPLVNSKMSNCAGIITKHKSANKMNLKIAVSILMAVTRQKQGLRQVFQKSRLHRKKSFSEFCARNAFYNAQ